VYGPSGVEACISRVESSCVWTQWSRGLLQCHCVSDKFLACWTDSLTVLVTLTDLQHVASTIPLATKRKAVSEFFVFALYRATVVDPSSAADFSRG
jgi:hypothetical protein